MNYAKCIRCPKLDERSCDGPNFILMTLPEIVEWARARKEYLKITNEEIAERANMPLGTVAPFMAGRLKNSTLETIRPILAALVGGDLGEHPCPDSESLAAMEKELEALRKINSEGGQTAQQEIEYLKRDTLRLEAELARSREDHNQTVDFLRTELHTLRDALGASETRVGRWRVAGTLFLSLFIASLLLVIAYLMVDRSNPQWGIFWTSDPVPLTYLIVGIVAAAAAGVFIGRRKK